MKSTSQLINSYASRLVQGKSLPKFENISGAVELEIASSLDRRECENDLRDINSETNVGYDCSIETTQNYSYDNEVRIPFSTSNDIESILSIVRRLASYSVANSSCGLHVHINASKLVGGNLEKPANIRRLARLKLALVSTCKRWENAYYGLSSGRNRKLNSEYCNPIDEYEVNLAKRTQTSESLSDLATIGKYKLINFNNLANRNYHPNERTIEFRGFAMNSGNNAESYREPSAQHIETNLFFLFNFLSCALFNARNLDKLRFDAKHPLARQSFNLFCLHVAKRTQLERWSNETLVKNILSHSFECCERFDRS
jgi:hypothetical protein